MSAKMILPSLIKWVRGEMVFAIIFSAYLTTSSSLSLAESLGQNKAAHGPYNYNAVCLFIDFAISSNISAVDQILVTGKPYITQLESEGYVAGVLHAENGIRIYKYQHSGVRAILVQNSNGIFVKDISITGSLIPKDLRSKKYLYGIFQIESGSEPLSLDCDAYKMKMVFSDGALDLLEITSSVD